MLVIIFTWLRKDGGKDGSSSRVPLPLRVPSSYPLRVPAAPRPHVRRRRRILDEGEVRVVARVVEGPALVEALTPGHLSPVPTTSSPPISLPSPRDGHCLRGQSGRSLRGRGPRYRRLLIRTIAVTESPRPQDFGKSPKRDGFLPFSLFRQSGIPRLPSPPNLLLRLLRNSVTPRRKDEERRNIFHGSEIRPPRESRGRSLLHSLSHATSLFTSPCNYRLWLRERTDTIVKERTHPKRQHRPTGSWRHNCNFSRQPWTSCRHTHDPHPDTPSPSL